MIKVIRDPSIKASATKQKALTEALIELSYEHYLDLQYALRHKRRELLLFCQHPPTITRGTQAHCENLLVNLQQLQKQGVSYLRVGRGGDHTAHELGQCVIYPHIDLRKRNLRIRDFSTTIVEITRQALEQVWDIISHTNGHGPGLYRSSDGAKIASIGLQCKGYFTSYGIALNVFNSLETFSYIHPCGFSSLAVCSVRDCNKDVYKLPQFISLWTSKFQNWLYENSIGLATSS